MFTLHNLEWFAAGAAAWPSCRVLVLLARLTRLAAAIRRVRRAPGTMELPPLVACPVAGCVFTRGHLSPCSVDGDPGRLSRL